MTALEALKACPLFKDFTETGLQILSSVASYREYPAGVPLFVENMVGDSLLVLASGKVRLSSKNKNGEEVALGELQKGAHLGEVALLCQGQRLCTAIASEPVGAYELRHADFQKLMTQKPQACLKLVLAVVRSLSQGMQENRENFKQLLTRA